MSGPADKFERCMMFEPKEFGLTRFDCILHRSILPPFTRLPCPRTHHSDREHEEKRFTSQAVEEFEPSEQIEYRDSRKSSADEEERKLVIPEVPRKCRLLHPIFILLSSRLYVWLFSIFFFFFFFFFVCMCVLFVFICYLFIYLFIVFLSRDSHFVLSPAELYCCI